MSSDSSDDNDDVFRQRTLSFNTAEELSRRDDFAINGFDYHSMGEFLEQLAFKEIEIFVSNIFIQTSLGNIS